MRTPTRGSAWFFSIRPAARGPSRTQTWSSITTTQTGNQCSPSPAATVRSSIVLAPAYALGVHSASADGVARSVERSRAAKKPRSDMRGRLSGRPRRVKVPRRIVPRRIDSGARPSLTAGMARLPYVEPATAPEHVRELLEQLPVKLNVFRMMAHAETDFRPLVGLGTAILGRQKLSAKLRELAILRVAALSPARYEWVQHVPIAQAMGATPAQVAALERGDIAADAFDPLEQAVLRFTTEVVRDVRASEATFAELARHLSAQEIVELIVTVGYYMMIARLLETTAVDLDPPAGTKKSCPGSTGKRSDSPSGRSASMLAPSRM